jgi:multicomponent Na+:H+ antiporter subunit D
MIAQVPILIVVIPLISSLLCPLIGRWRKEACYSWTVFSLSLCALASINTLIAVIDSGTIHYRLGGWSPPWGIEYVVDHLNALMLVLVSFISLMVAISSKKSVEQEVPDKFGFFYPVFLLQVTGLLGIVVTGDMFNLYVFLEIASLAGYALIAIGEDGAPLASFRYIVMGTIGACFYLLGVGYVYMATGSLNMADLAHLLPDLYASKVITVAFGFFMVGIALKIALFPLHAWLPDAYTRAPSSVSALLAPLMTKVGAYVMIRVMFTVFKPEFPVKMLHVTDIMVWFGTFAILFGGIMALSQTDFKRMLCYIIVAEIGFIVGGIGIANPTAIKGAIFHILNDALMAACLFLVAGIVMYRTNGHNISDFKGIFGEMPFTATVLTVGALAVIGVPPTCGFFSKWYLLLGGIEAKHWGFVMALLFCTLINIALFFRVIDKGLYIHASEHSSEPTGLHSELHSREAPISMLIPALVIAIAILLIGIFNQAILTNIISFAVPPGL